MVFPDFMGQAMPGRRQSKTDLPDTPYGNMNCWQGWQTDVPAWEACFIIGEASQEAALKIFPSAEIFTPQATGRAEIFCIEKGTADFCSMSRKEHSVQF